MPKKACGELLMDLSRFKEIILTFSKAKTVTKYRYKFPLKSEVEKFIRLCFHWFLQIVQELKLEYDIRKLKLPTA